MARGSSAKSKPTLDELVDEVVRGGGPVLIRHRKKPVAAVIRIEDLELFEKLEDEIDIREAKKAMADPRPSIPWEKVKRKLKL